MTHPIAGELHLAFRRILLSGCVLGGICSTTLAQNKADPEAVRAMVEQRFSELDANDDEQLDEDEIQNVPAADLESLRANGLGSAPISREDYVLAGVAIVMNATPNDSKEPEDPRRSPMKAPETPGKPATTRPGKKGRLVLELPAEYLARDKNGDGQIGLYEWDRKKYAEFAKLDKNGDGFLTASELVSKESLKALYAKTAGSDTGKNTSGKGTTGSESRGSSGSGANDSVDAEARGAFLRLDENKDSSIDETEWSRSRNSRQMIEGSGAKVTLPLKMDDFVALYRAAKK